MQTALIILNLVASLASAAWAVVAIIRPASLSSSNHIESGGIFYVRMYAARSIPFGLAAGVLPFWYPGKAVACVLFTAAVIQLADVMIAVGTRDRRMILGAAVGAIVHLFCGLTML